MITETEIEALIETYINGNISIVRDIVLKKPYLQLEIYTGLPEDLKPRFKELCRKWNKDKHHR